MDHIPPDVLLRFVEGHATREEVRGVVRHLLRGCGECGSSLYSLHQAYLACDEQAYGEVIRRCLERITQLKPDCSAQERLARDNPDTALWLAAGLHTRAAIALAGAGIVTLEDLAEKTQAELEAIPAFGKRSLRALERLLGRPLPTRRLDPGVVFWMAKGFMRSAAIALCQAGIHSLEDLAGADRETLESLHRVGRAELSRCEELLGRPIAAKRDYWLARGLSPRTASGLIAAGVDTLADLTRLTREEFLLRQGLAETALAKCEELLGRRLPSPEEEWRRRGCKTRPLARKLTQAGILTEEDLRRKSGEELAAAGLRPDEVTFCKRLVRKKTKRTARGGRPISPGDT